MWTDRQISRRSIILQYILKDCMFYVLWFESEDHTLRRAYFINTYQSPAGPLLRSVNRRTCLFFYVILQALRLRRAYFINTYLYPAGPPA
jgi:hypothetical protein